MANDGSIKIGTQLDDSGLKSALGSLASKGFGVLKAATGAAVAGITAVSGALIAGATAGIKYNATMEDYTTNFKVMLGDSQAALDHVAKLKEFAAKTPFEMSDLANASKTLLAFGVEAEKGTEIMKMLGDVSLGDSQKFSSLALVFGQVSSQGKLMGQDLLQMINAGFNPLQVISEQTGESMEALKDKMSKGQIGIDEVTEAFRIATSEGGKFYNGMEEGSKTFNGMVSTLKDNATALLGDITASLQEEGKALVGQATTIIEKLTTAFSEGGTDGLISAGAKVLADVLLGVANEAPRVIDIAVNIVTQFCDSIESNSGAYAEAGLKLIVGLTSGIVSATGALLSTAGTLIIALAQGIIDNLPVIQAKAKDILQSISAGVKANLPLMWENGVEIMSQLIVGIADMLPDLINTGVELLVTLCETLSSPTSLGKIIDTGITLLIKLTEGLLNAIPKLIAAIPKIVAALVVALIENVPKLITAAQTIMTKLASFLIQYLPELMTAPVKIVMSMVDYFKGVNWGDVGVNIIRGIRDGVMNAAGELINAAVDAARKAMEGVKKFLGIRSPSRLMRDVIGKNMVAGIEVGIEAKKDDLADSATGAIEGAVSAMQKASGELVQGMQGKALEYTLKNDSGAAREARDTENGTPKDDPIDYDKLAEANGKRKTVLRLNNREFGRMVEEVKPT